MWHRTEQNRIVSCFQQEGGKKSSGKLIIVLWEFCELVGGVGGGEEGKTFPKR